MLEYKSIGGVLIWQEKIMTPEKKELISKLIE